MFNILILFSILLKYNNFVWTGLQNGIFQDQLS